MRAPFVLLAAVLIATGDQRTEPQLVLCRGDKRADHCAIVVRLAVVPDVQPKIVTTLIAIASQVTEVLHQNERRVVLTGLLDLAVARNVRIRNVLEIRDLNHVAHNQRAAAARVHGSNLLLSLEVVGRTGQACCIKELVDELRVAYRVWISCQKCRTLHPLISESLFVRFQTWAIDDFAAVGALALLNRSALEAAGEAPTRSSRLCGGQS